MEEEIDVDKLRSDDLNKLIGYARPSNVGPTNLIPEATLKKDTDKLRYDLVPAEAIEELVKVYTFGAKKYAPHSWEAGMKVSRIYAALLRHITAWWMGEDVDKESGLSHLAHAAWNVIALLTYAKRGMRETDDRPFRFNNYTGHTEIKGELT